MYLFWKCDCTVLNSREKMRIFVYLKNNNEKRS
jgi:hypothetical protein